MTARHSPLFTLESGQSGLGIYISGRDAAENSGLLLGTNGPICVHFTARNCPDPLLRNWSGLIQEAPNGAEYW
jgi:hypothetical protein